PGPGPFTLYRGVAGRGRARRVRGISWTADPDTASWFAYRYSGHLFGLSNALESPAVFRGIFDEPDILAYINDRNEEDFIVDVPKGARIESIFTEDDIEARASIAAIRRREEDERRLAEIKESRNRRSITKEAIADE